VPNLEYLDERTKQILSRLDDMDLRITRRFDAFDETVGARLSELDKDVSEIKISAAREDGQKSVTLWVGGLVLAIVGAIGNMLLVWILGPRGPLGS
jgi:hypothetical protein